LTLVLDNIKSNGKTASELKEFVQAKMQKELESMDATVSSI